MKAEKEKEEKNKVPAKKSKRSVANQHKKEAEADAQRRLAVELNHQKHESERRALVRKMVSDGEGNKATFNTSCLNVLNNYQGIYYG